MSARDNVRRLFESAIMNARAVISDMKTMCMVDQNHIWGYNWAVGEGDWVPGHSTTRTRVAVLVRYGPTPLCSNANNGVSRTFASFAKEDRRIRGDHL